MLLTYVDGMMDCKAKVQSLFLRLTLNPLDVDNDEALATNEEERIEDEAMPLKVEVMLIEVIKSVNVALVVVIDKPTLGTDT